MLRKFIGPTLGDKEVDVLRLVDTDFIQAAAIECGKSRPKAAIITYRRLLHYIERCGDRLPFDLEKVDVPKYVIQKSVQALTIEEITKIREFLCTPNYSKHASRQIKDDCAHANLRTRCLIEVLLHTGLRISEALAVDVKDIDFERNELRIRNAKSEKWETVFLYGSVLIIREYLASRSDPNPALFISAKGTRLCDQAAKSMMKRLKKKIDIKKNLTHHIWRKTFITLLLKYGKDPKKTQILARHRSLQTTLNHYYALEDDEVKDYHEDVMGRI